MSYNGWSNRATWAAALHLGNAQPWYEETRELIADLPLHDAAQALKDTWEERLDPVEWSDNDAVMPRDYANMLSDIGAVWEVDWVEVAKSFQED